MCQAGQRGRRPRGGHQGGEGEEDGVVVACGRVLRVLAVPCLLLLDAVAAVVALGNVAVDRRHGAELRHAVGGEEVTRGRLLHS